MNQISENKGIVTVSGNTSVRQSAVGDNARVNIGAPARRSAESTGASQFVWHMGVVTILAEEMAAVRDVFNLVEGTERPAGRRYYTGRLALPPGAFNVVAARTLGSGQRSAMAALDALRQEYDPMVLALTGVSGAIRDDIAIDDVVLATSIVYYDTRKVTPGGVIRRGEELHPPVTMIHAINSFFTDYGEPATLNAADLVPFRVFPGPIGSGDAVIADDASEIRRYLTAYNDKTLALDTEAGGFGRHCHETPSAGGRIAQWIVVRGISDHANDAKNDDNHSSAAMHAARTLRALVPYIHPAG